MQDYKYHYDFFCRRLDYVINIVFTRKGGKGGAPMSMARLCFLQVLIYYPRDFSPALRFIPPLKNNFPHSKFDLSSVSNLGALDSQYSEIRRDGINSRNHL